MRGLTLEESVKMTEDLIEFAEEFIDNFFEDKPMCLKFSLKKRKNVKRGI